MADRAVGTHRRQRRHLRGMRVMASLAWRADRRRFLVIVSLLPLEVLSFVGFGLSIRAFFNAAIAGSPTPTAVAAGCAAASFGLQFVGGQLRGNLAQHLDQKAGLLVDADILRITASMPGLEHLERPEYLDRITRVRGQGAWIIDSFWSTLISAGQVARLLTVAVLLASVQPLLLVIGAAAVVPIYLQRVGERRVRRASLAAAENSRLDEHLLRLRLEPATAKEVLITGAAPRLEALSAAARRAAGRLESRAQAVSGLIALAGWVVFLASYVGGIAVVTSLVLERNRTIGDLVMVVILATQLKSQVEVMLFTLGLAQKGTHILDSYLWLLDFERDSEDRRPERRTPPTVLREGIALHDVDFTYPGTDRPVLRGVDLRLRPGMLVAVVGEHGSGKTTLVKLLSGFYRPTRGSIRVDGVDLADVDSRLWQARVTAAYQNFARYELSARETVGIGDLAGQPGDDEVWRALHDADADEIVRGLPDRLDARFGTRFGGVDLSTGQWQRMALARACIGTDPLLVVLDEPTASLDPVSEHAVFERHHAVARRAGRAAGAITVLVTHRFSTVVMADLILVLRGGRIVEAGDHATLCRDGGLYAQLFESQKASYV